MAERVRKSTYKFKAEVKQLLDILARSLYTNREIFLRELVSNSSDALDKLRFETNRSADVADADLPLEIHIDFDKDEGILRVRDTGVGMTREELIRDIGTIARSGSAEFLQAAAARDELDGIIGKFGVGFYSVYMVAKEVVILTRSYRVDEPGLMWRSDGEGSFEISAPGEELKRGTTVEIHLRDDAKDLAEAWRLVEIVRRHSAFVSFPIFVGDERINTIPALWREPKFNIEEERYHEFYKYLTRDTEEPFDTLHVAVDAPVQYNALLFIPKQGFDLFGMQRERPGLDLYIKRVLIQRGNKELIPEYLGFVRGVVDSEDLPLNISRETLQENRNLLKITTNITKQLLGHLEKVAKDSPERYEELWRLHGKVFKLGYTDFANRERWGSLLRFNSSWCDDSEGLVSLDQYIERAKEGQKAIYYALGSSRESFSLNPHLEIFRSKGLDVLYLFEPIDEFALESLRTYQEFELKSVEHADSESLEAFETQGDDGTSSESAQPLPPLTDAEEKAFEGLLARFKELLGDRVTDVRPSTRLKESPCCLVSPDGAMTSSMQRILQLIGKDSSIPSKVLEVNRDHKLIRNLMTIHGANADDDYLELAVEHLFEASLLLDGYLADPHALVERIQKLLNQSSGWYLAVK